METKSVPFSGRQRDWYESACANINAQRITDLVCALTDIHSPTGAERDASEYLAGYLPTLGIDARYQAITNTSGNCVGRIKGNGTGPSLLLFAPIDTNLDADPEADVPMVGPALRADMQPQAQVRGDTVIGLGASNPSSMVATLTEALACTVAAGVEFTGDVIIAACAGGMPWVVPERSHAGISHGVMHLLSHGVAPDFGIILKPWDYVFWEHPGMCWFKVTTWGTMCYAGLPRGTPGFDSSLLPATKVIQALEQWLTDYPQQHISEQVKPEGWLSAVRSGSPDKVTWPGAATEIYLDIRTSPDQTNADIEAEFGTVMRGIVARHPDVEADWQMIVSCRSARTDPDHWIVHSARRGWEQRHGKPYPGAPLMSGQTDAATICQMGIPLARIGFETEIPEEFSQGLGGMGVAHIPSLVGPCQSTIYSIIDCCTRTRAEVGLG